MEEIVFNLEKYSLMTGKDHATDSKAKQNFPILLFLIFFYSCLNKIEEESLFFVLFIYLFIYLFCK